jgi:hypothetical protein
MKLNFRRRQKLFPGVYLNFSSKGVSTTIGVKGISVNHGKEGTYLNTSIPGTGIYSRSKLSDNNNNSTTEKNQIKSSFTEEPFYFFPKKLEGEIKSNDANSVTSEGLAEMKETLLAAYQEKLDIQKEIPKVEEEIKKAATNKLLSQIFIIGFFTSKFKDLHSEKINYLKDLKQQLIECKVNIDINIDNNIKEKYEAIKLAFNNLSKSAKIWDKTSAVKNNESRSAASNSISRKLTELSNKKIEFINADFDALYFKNQNGSDIFIYPAFAVLFDNKKNFGLVDLSDLQVSFKLTKFLEEESVPNDSKIIGESWAKINKDGTPDKRFKGNYQIPIVEYGEIEFKSNSGIYEVFMFSNPSFANDFVDKYNSYLN